MQLALHPDFDLPATGQVSVLAFRLRRVAVFGIYFVINPLRLVPFLY